jgi:predicted TIM-barrel fold metal-dependent hydrolase
MQVIDMHAHWATTRGYPFQTEAELVQQEVTFRSKPRFRTEEEMAADLRAFGVRVILDFGFTKSMSPEEASEVHDYGFEVQGRCPDVILGHWIHAQPGPANNWLKEFRRCLDKGRQRGFIGLNVQGSGGPPASDDSWDPFYRLCIEADIPALIYVGTTGLGAGLPGGNGIELENCHPRHVDRVAARYPELRILAGRPAWPWQSEMIAILLHKPNVWYELHGWSPKYFSSELCREIPRRLRDRVMFGSDYPLFSYERLLSDWKALGLDDDMLAKVLVQNARRFLHQAESDAG